MIPITNFKKLAALAAIVFSFQTVTATSWDKELESYNITWDSQSTVSQDSMPLSGGLLGLNVWVENNELKFFAASTSVQNEQGFQVKLGLFTISLGNDGFAKEFKQVLKLKESEIEISGKTESGKAVNVTLWCSINKPVIHIDIRQEEASQVKISYETWADHQMEYRNGLLQFYARNADVNELRQHRIGSHRLEEFKQLVPDPLSKLTCGGLIYAKGLKDAGKDTGELNGLPTRRASVITQQAVSNLDIIIGMRFAQDDTLEDWQNAVFRYTGEAVKNKAADRAEALAWWDEFWDRSYIRINPDMPNHKGWKVARNYQLSRYQFSANASGKMPTLFNGHVFDSYGDPDRRYWDQYYYIIQNMRLCYWPLYKTGDFDMVLQPFDFLAERVPLQEAFAKQYWDVNGFCFPEIVDPFGMDSGGIHPDGRSIHGHLRFHYTGYIEMAYMMLHYQKYTGASIEKYIPYLDGLVTYFDEFYQKTNKEITGKNLDSNGKLVLYPLDALEVFNGGTNSTDALSGLYAVARELVALPNGVITADRRRYYERFLERLPPIALEEVEGKQMVAPAEKYESVFTSPNMEFPNMYVLFPFDYYFLGREGDGIEIAKHTWEHGAISPIQQQIKCWYQTGINMARMGRGAEAKKYAEAKSLAPSLRFPTFYSNVGFCCAGPDTDHAGTSMIGLQEMLMQCDDQRILITPAWPSNWNGSFKLHAPYKTVVEGRIVDGKAVIDRVTPESRRKDITIYETAVSNDPVSDGKKITASGVWGANYEADKASDGIEATRWAAPAGVTSSWLEIDLGAVTEVNRIWIKESSQYPFIKKFALEVKREDGTWEKLEEGNELIEQEYKFTDLEGRYFRVNVIESTTNASIEEFQIWGR